MVQTFEENRSSLRPAEIAGRRFPVTRKGYDPQEVERFLQDLGDHTGHLEAELERQRARGDLLEQRSLSALEAAYARASRHLTDVMVAAEKAAEEIRRHAEDEARKTTAAAEARAAQLTMTARTEAERRLAEATAEAEGLIAHAAGGVKGSPPSGDPVRPPQGEVEDGSRKDEGRPVTPADRTQAAAPEAAALDDLDLDRFFAGLLDDPEAR